MTHPKITEGGQMAAQRWKESAFNKSIKPTPIDNARANQRALSKMTLLERETGLTPEQYEAYHAEQRARVLKRYGLAA